MKQDMRALRFADDHIGATAAEERALAVRSDVNVDHTGHRGRGGLDPLRFEAMIAECATKKIAEFILANAANKARLHAPAGKRQGAIGGDSTEVHFEVRGEAIVSGLRPAIHRAENIHIDVAENDNCVTKGHWWRSLSLPIGRDFA